MLQNIRESVTGPLAWFIVGLIVLPFAFFGLDQFNTGGSDPVLVEVGDQQITQTQFQRGYQQRYQQLASMMGENFRPDMIDQQRFQASVLDDLVQESMLKQYIADQGFHVTDGELFEFIKQVPAFQQDGKFSTDAYRQALSNQGENPTSWERRLRSSLQIDQMRRGVLGSAIVAPGEIALSRELEEQQRFLSYASFKATDYTDSVTIGDEEIDQYFEANRARFTAPERIKLAYVELDADKLESGDVPSPEVLRVVYDAEKNARFATPEERRASHVLIKFGADKAAARARLETIRQAIVDGADFAAQAKAHSEDTGSKSAGGSLGWVRRGQMVESFEQTLFGLADGALSEVIESEFGWHIIQLNEVRASKVQPFEDEAVQQQLQALYKGREGERRFQELADQMEQIAFESPSSLDAVVAATGLKAQETEWFGRNGGSGIAIDDEVQKVAFSAEVLDGENSRPISLGPKRLVVVRKSAYEPARQRELAEVRTEVHAELIRTRTAKMAAEKAEQVLTEVKAGTSFEDAAKAVEATVLAKGLVKRNDSSVDRAIMSRLFTLPHPAEGKSEFARVALSSGDTAVIALSAVQTPQTELSEDAAAQAASRVSDALAGAEFAAYRAFIRDEVKIKMVRSPITDDQGQ